MKKQGVGFEAILAVRLGRLPGTSILVQKIDNSRVFWFFGSDLTLIDCSSISKFCLRMLSYYLLQTLKSLNSATSICL